MNKLELSLAYYVQKNGKYLLEFGREHVDKNNVFSYFQKNTIDQQIEINIKKIYRQLKSIVKTKYQNSISIRKIVSVFIHGICQGHCKYVQTHKYEERALETKEDEIIRVACIIRNIYHCITLQWHHLQYAAQLLYPTKQFQPFTTVDVPKIKTNVYLRKKISEYSDKVITSKYALQYWNYIIFEINK